MSEHTTPSKPGNPPHESGGSVKSVSVISTGTGEGHQEHIYGTRKPVIYTPCPPHICPRSHQRTTSIPRMPPNSFGGGCVPRSPIQSEVCLNIAGYTDDFCSWRLGAHSAQLILSIIATLTTTHEAICDPHDRLTVSLLTFDFIRSVRRRKNIGYRKNEKTKTQAGLLCPC